MSALETMSPETLDKVMPVIELTLSPAGSNQLPPADRLMRLPQRLRKSLGDRSFFLDAHKIRFGRQVTVKSKSQFTEGQIFEGLVDDVVQGELNAVPVFTPNIDASIVDLLRQLACHGQGACLRLPMHAVPSLGSYGRELERLQELAGTEPWDTDVILDMGFLDPDQDIRPRHIGNTIEQLLQLAQFRNVILIGTVIPEKLSTFAEGEINPILRHEWSLWNVLRRHGMSRLPTFGDYGIQHPSSPSGGGRGVRPTIRYTTSRHFLIARGAPSDSHRAIAAKLIDHPDFPKSSFNWEDRFIVDCATGYGPPGNHTTWRKVGMLHHVHEVILALSKPDNDGTWPPTAYEILGAEIPQVFLA
jgi:hypothetical protein